MLCDGRFVIPGEVVAAEVLLARCRRARSGVLDFHLIGSNSLNLIQDVLLAGQSDGHHQDERRRADNHAQGGEHEANFVDAEAVNRELNQLAEHHGSFGARERAFKGSVADTADGWHRSEPAISTISVRASYELIGQ